MRIERVAVIRWSTLAFVAVLLFPSFFFALREHGCGGAVGDGDGASRNRGRSRLLQCKGALLGNRSFSIHDRLLLRFSVKSLSLGVVIETSA